MKIVYEPIDYPSITLCNINPVRTQALETYGTDALIDFVEAIQPVTAYREDREMGDGTTEPPDDVTDVTGDVTEADNDTTLAPPTGSPPVGKRRRKVMIVYNCFNFCYG